MPSDFETADSFDKGRASAAPFLGLVILLAQQGILFAWEWGSQSVMQTAVWLIFAATMLALLMTGGTWLLPSRVRAVANDEVSRANRAIAIQAGFAVTMVTGLIVWVVAPFEPLHAQRAANLIVSMGLGSAFAAFAMAEIRSHA